MDDLRTSLRQLGRRIAPDVATARARVMANRGETPSLRLQITRRVAEIGVGVALSLIVLGVGAAALFSHHPRPNPGTAGVVATSPPATAPTTAQPNATSTAIVTGQPTAAANGVPPPSRTPAPTPTATTTVSLTNANDGQTIRVTRGTVIRVFLTPDQDAKAGWNDPQSDDPHIAQRQTSSRGADGSVSATFLAAADGSTRLLAGAIVTCPSTPCAGYGAAMAWFANIVVSG